ncbi:MAG: TonB C-terminal domain-containing protein [Myxococcales bacterium]|nr:TonB C-terminal domain-containing protein [Myxococcales bacterium]
MVVAHPSSSLSRGLASNRSKIANRGLTGILFTSLILHVGAVGGVIYVGGLRQTVDLNLEAMPVELVTLGKPREPELLPRKITPQPPPQPPPDPAPADVALESIQQPEPAKPEPEEPKVQKPKSRRKRVRKLSATARKLLEGRDEDLDRALKKLDDPEGSEDGSPLGTTTNRAAAATAYEGQVATVLRSRYQLPTTIPPSQRRFLEAEIILYINRRGTITRYEYAKRHSNTAFMSALENLLRSVNLPPPPKVLAREYATSGLVVRFKPD